MTDAFTGEIILWPALRVPVNWNRCDGTLLRISEYSTLYALLGTAYGGDGQTTFGVPDLRGRVPVHAGAAPGMQSYGRGQTGGAEQVTLTTQQLPAHSHQLSIASGPGTSKAGTNGGAIASMGPSNSTTGVTYASPGGTQVPLAGIGSTGGTQSHTNIQPSLVLNYIICLNGVYPQPPT